MTCGSVARIHIDIGAARDVVRNMHHMHHMPMFPVTICSSLLFPSIDIIFCFNCSRMPSRLFSSSLIAAGAGDAADVMVATVAF